MDDDTPPYGYRLPLMNEAPTYRVQIVFAVLAFLFMVFLIAALAISGIHKSDNRRLEYRTCVAAHSPADCTVSLNGL